MQHISFLPNKLAPFTSLSSVNKGALPWLLVQLYRQYSKILYISDEASQLELLVKQINYLDSKVAVEIIEAWDNIAYDTASPHIEISAQRIKALYNLSNNSSWRGILIVPSKLLMGKLITPEIIWDNIINLKLGEQINRNELIDRLISIGFSRQASATQLGDFAIRGNLIDIVIAENKDNNNAHHNSHCGYRLDFFGNKLESIRCFDPVSQLSTGAFKEELLLLPISEVIMTASSIEQFTNSYRQNFSINAIDSLLYQSVSNGKRYFGIENWLPLFYQNLVSIFDYLPKNILVTRSSNLEADLAEFSTTIEANYAERKKFNERRYYPIEPASLWYKPLEVKSMLSAYQQIEFTEFKEYNSIDSNIKPLPNWLHDLAAPAEDKKSPLSYLKDILEQNYGRHYILVTCYSAGSRDRLANIFAAHDMLYRKIDHYNEIEQASKGIVCLGVMEISNGFVSPELIVITEEEVLGERISNLKRKKRSSTKILQEAASFTAGEIVVHRDHGIGKFEGLENLTIANIAHDCLCISYFGGDKLYIPVENIDVISKYGPENGIILDKLGSLAWQSRKAKLRNRVKLAAEYLLKIAAERKLRKAFIFTPLKDIFDEFCARFPYAETEDQLDAVNDILADLESGMPMDRLICGDVGFGKTEVAMRAACAVLYHEDNGEKLAASQIAVVVPTTLLARQHYINFSARFAHLPVKVRQLSRLVPAREAKKTRDDLAVGNVDIIIGTHALLAKSIEFKNLALLVVDEEQHFGVAQKERLKELSSNLHVVTLTATPIPRSLQMSLIGIRSLSLLATAPIDRLAIKTFIMPFDDLVIREAILHELGRGGRVFYISPYIKDLEKLYTELSKLVPEAKIVMAHGQINNLDDIMNKFYDGNIDILLSTSIIESGIDVEAANTIIINKAHMFGLAQLYQMRGRVGRGKLKAYAYLLIPPHRILTDDANKRLEVMQKLDNLGAGFTLASHDMDIRGFGNLLGDEQSGHIKEVGIELYQDMLQEAIESLSGITSNDNSRRSPTINLGVSVLIPAYYVEDLSLRLSLYRRIADLTNSQEIDSFAAELVDRFGPLPEEIEHLLAIILLKQLCAQCNIEKLDLGAKAMIISFYDNKFPQPENLMDYVLKRSQSHKLRSDHKLVITKAIPGDFNAKFNKIKQEIQNICALIA